MIKTLKKVGLEGTYLSIIIPVCEKPIANITFSAKNRKLSL